MNEDKIQNEMLNLIEQGGIGGHPFPREDPSFDDVTQAYDIPTIKQILFGGGLQEHTIMDIPFEQFSRHTSFTQENIRHLLIDIIKSHSLGCLHLNEGKTDFNEKGLEMVTEALIHAQNYCQTLFQRDINHLFSQDGFQHLSYDTNIEHVDEITALCQKGSKDLNEHDYFTLVNIDMHRLHCCNDDQKKTINNHIEYFLISIHQYHNIRKSIATKKLKHLQNILKHKVAKIRIASIDDLASFLYMHASKGQTLTDERKRQKDYAKDQYSRGLFFKVMIAEMEARSNIDFDMMKKKIETLRKHFESLLKDQFKGNFYIERRTKTLDSVITKMLNKKEYSETQAIKDLFGFRITIFRNTVDNPNQDLIKDIIVQTYKSLGQSFGNLQFKSKGALFQSMHADIIAMLNKNKIPGKENSHIFQIPDRPQNTQAHDGYSDGKFAGDLLFKDVQEEYGLEIQFIDEQHTNEKHYAMHLFLDIKKEIELTSRVSDDHLVRYKYIKQKIEEKFHEYNCSYDNMMKYIDQKIIDWTSSPVANIHDQFWKKVKEYIIQQYGIWENIAEDEAKANKKPYIKIDFTNTKDHQYGSIIYKDYHNDDMGCIEIDLQDTTTASQKGNKYEEIMTHITDEFLAGYGAISQVRHKQSNVSQFKAYHTKKQNIANMLVAECKSTLTPQQIASNLYREYLKVKLKTLKNDQDSNKETIRTIENILAISGNISLRMEEGDLEKHVKEKMTYYCSNTVLELLEQLIKQDTDSSPYLEREVYDQKNNKRIDLKDYDFKKKK